MLGEGGERFCYETLLDYIHLNPARARLVRVTKGGSILDYRWSSLTMGYACRRGNERPGWPRPLDWRCRAYGYDRRQSADGGAS